MGNKKNSYARFSSYCVMNERIYQDPINVYLFAMLFAVHFEIEVNFHCILLKNLMVALWLVEDNIF